MPVLKEAPIRSVSAETLAWEAQTELDIGVLIHSYLLTHPAPADSDVARRLAGIGEDLQIAGRERLDRFGLHRLRLGGRRRVMAELSPRLNKDDVVRIVGVFNTGDVQGVVRDDYQSVVPGEDEPPAAKRRVSIDGEEAWPLLPIKDGALVSVFELVLLVNESDLFLIEGGDA